jgi:hypothetical protein
MSYSTTFELIYYLFFVEGSEPFFPILLLPQYFASTLLNIRFLLSILPSSSLLTMASNETAAQSPLRIVVGSDNAGHDLKMALKETLSKHKGVASVMDVGVLKADDPKAYAHLAVDACKKIKSGEARKAPPILLNKSTDIYPG